MTVFFLTVFFSLIVIHFAAKPTALAHSFTRNVRAEHAGGQTMMEKAPSGIPAIVLQSTLALSQKLPAVDKTYYLSPTSPQKRIFSKVTI